MQLLHPSFRQLPLPVSIVLTIMFHTLFNPPPPLPLSPFPLSPLSFSELANDLHHA